MLPLHGVFLYAEVTNAESTPDKQALMITLEGPPGTVELLNQEIAFGPPSAGIRAASVTLRMDGLGIATPGHYTIRLTAEGREVGSHRVEATVARGKVRARFGAFVQDEQGVDGERRYLRARLPFTLYGESNEFGGYHIAAISQPEGRNFEEDPLVIEVAPGYERLNAAYGFTSAVHRAYDGYAQQMFGGHLPDGAGITMRSNLVISVNEVEFDLPEENSAGGW